VLKNEYGSKIDKDGGSIVDNKQIHEIIKNIENNISKCDILSGILCARIGGQNIDYDGYYNRGYTQEEVRIGAELVDLYLKLKGHIDKIADSI